MTRTFIAFEMHEDVQLHLEGVIRQVAHVLPHVRWVNPAGIHLTLAFLGELTDEQLVAAIQGAEIAARQSKPFSYRLSKIGIFGSLKHPRVIWMGIHEPSEKLLRLHSMLNIELRRRGFEVDARPFSPHLTLARIKTPLTRDEQQGLEDILKRQGNVASKEYEVRHIDVMKSELTGVGATYTSLRAYDLYSGSG